MAARHNLGSALHTLKKFTESVAILEPLVRKCPKKKLSVKRHASRGLNSPWNRPACRGPASPPCRSRMSPTASPPHPPLLLFSLPLTLLYAKQVEDEPNCFECLLSLGHALSEASARAPDVAFVCRAP